METSFAENYSQDASTVKMTPQITAANYPNRALPYGGSAAVKSSRSISPLVAR